MPKPDPILKNLGVVEVDEPVFDEDAGCDLVCFRVRDHWFVVPAALLESAAKWNALPWLSQKLTDPEVRKGYIGEAVTAAVENERYRIMKIVRRYAETGSGDAADILEAIRARTEQGEQS
jgi:hypothetical protein